MIASIRIATRSALAAILFAGAAACSSKSSSPTLASDLQGDLEAAKSSSIELANDGSRRTQVVSAEELTGATPQRAPESAPKAVAHKATTSRTPAPTPLPVSTPAPAAVVVAPAPVPPVVSADTLRPMGSRPTPSTPTATPARRGGYKSVGDIIRNAPFPINP